MDRLKNNIIQNNKTKPTPVEWIIDRWIERGTLDHHDMNEAKSMEQEMINKLKNNIQH